MKGEAGFQFFNASQTKIGPNGKYLFGRVGDQTVIFDIEARKTVGAFSQQLQITNNFGFNDAMTQAAFTESQRLVIWDLVQDREIAQVFLPFQMEQFILVDTIESGMITCSPPHTDSKPAASARRQMSSAVAPSIPMLLAKASPTFMRSPSTV